MTEDLEERAKVEVEFNDIKPLSLEVSEQDNSLHRNNCDASLLSSRMRDLTPLLAHVGFYYEEVGIGTAIGVVPLKSETMNQNGTQQGSIFYLLSDCTAGVALLSAIPGIYVVGVHDRCQAQPTQMWLRSNYIKYIHPGTGTLRAIAKVDMSLISQLRHQLISEGRTQTTVQVEIYQQDLLIATATPLIGIYLDNPRSANIQADLVQKENAKISAKLIAGLRQHDITNLVASEQGAALAERFTQILPQLPNLIQARTLSLHRYLEVYGIQHSQVVVLGVGLDMRPTDFACPSQIWYGLDMISCLQERRRLTKSIGIEENNPNFHLVAADLRMNGWIDKLLEDGFVDSDSTLFILEGLSMYLTTINLAELLKTIANKCSNKANRVWIDHITDKMFYLNIYEVQQFLSTMSRLGEPLITGFEQIDEISEQWQESSRESSLDYLHESLKTIESIDIYEQYKFSILKSVS